MIEDKIIKLPPVFYKPKDFCIKLPVFVADLAGKPLKHLDIVNKKMEGEN